jgi:hypothetical protein
VVQQLWTRSSGQDWFALRTKYVTATKYDSMDEARTAIDKNELSTLGRTSTRGTCHRPEISVGDEYGDRAVSLVSAIRNFRPAKEGRIMASDVEEWTRQRRAGCNERLFFVEIGHQV